MALRRIWKEPHGSPCKKLQQLFSKSYPGLFDIKWRESPSRFIMAALDLVWLIRGQFCNCTHPSLHSLQLKRAMHAFSCADVVENLLSAVITCQPDIVPRGQFWPYLIFISDLPLHVISPTNFGWRWTEHETFSILREDHNDASLVSIWRCLLKIAFSWVLLPGGSSS